MKKLLAVSRKLPAPFGEGGGENILFDLMVGLDRTHRYRTTLLGAFRYADLPGVVDVLNSLNVPLELKEQVRQVINLGNTYSYPAWVHASFRVPGGCETVLARDDHFFESMAQLIEERQPETVLLHAEGSAEALNRLLLAECQVLLYVQNIAGMQPLGSRLPRRFRLLAISRFVADALQSRYGLKSELLYPAVDLERYRSSARADRRERFTALFINPVIVKGLFVLLHLIDAFPDVDFVVLEGWGPMDAKLARHLDSRPNARWLRKMWDMRSVYQLADLLIVPSQLEESFGRVVVEAHAAGVATLASRVGGLPEASGDAGMLVDDYKNPRAWVSALAAVLQNPELLDERKARLLENAARFATERACTRFEEVVNATA